MCFGSKRLPKKFLQYAVRLFRAIQNKLFTKGVISCFDNTVLLDKRINSDSTIFDKLLFLLCTFLLARPTSWLSILKGFLLFITFCDFIKYNEFPRNAYRYFREN